MVIFDVPSISTGFYANFFGFLNAT